MKTKLLSSALLAASALSAGNAHAALVADFPMDILGNSIKESVGGQTFGIEGRFAPMEIAAPNGKAWRTDGFTSRIVARVGDVVNGNTMTVKLVLAVDTYTIIGHEDAAISNNNIQTEVVSCLDEGRRSGFALYMGRTGKYTFKLYVGGQLISMEPSGTLPLWEWTDLTCTVNGQDVRLYKNGQQVAQRTAPSAGTKIQNAPLYIARANNNAEAFGANLATFNGAFDRISIWNDVQSPAFTAVYADLNLPANRYKNDIMRAQFHGQPGQNWTNETHGLFYNAADRLWHAFFQRTGSAPIMSHQHWGHITSPDLLTWKDDTPVLFPSEYYDIKGCWSGCVFTDQEVTGGKPAILYTGVDFAQPYAAMATCEDTQHLRKWKKAANNPLARVQGDGPHFRDTYFFRDASGAYMMIGSDNAVICYKYQNGSWVKTQNFYNCQEGVDRGFTEMPNVTEFPDGRWVMTTSPLASFDGTICLYRTGRVNNGTFQNYSAAQKVDILGRDGYGLLSPSIGKTPDGKIVALGIVADKMPTGRNLDHGYAHLYSLPREWSLDASGNLLQKPYSGVYALRNDAYKFSMANQTLEGTQNLSPVRGRQAEVSATFTVANSRFGFNFYKDERGRSASVSYNPQNRELKVDLGNIERYGDDRNINCFSAILPIAPSAGQDFKLQLFIDHSIVDVFVNDRYASSVRMFPTDEKANIIEVFADGATKVKSLEAYVLKDGSAMEEIIPEVPEIPETNNKVAMYVGYANAEALRANSQEYAAYQWFVGQFGADNVIYANQTSRFNAAEYDVIWINADRLGIPQGWRSLPAEFSSDAVVNALKNYVNQGGNLYLSKMATQLAEGLGRSRHTCAEFNSGDGGVGNDYWDVNITANGQDWTSHPIYYGLQKEDAGYGMLIHLLGNTAGLHREDHNCMWRLNDCGGHDGFCRENNARVLGTWGHDGGQAFAGIVEFLPQGGGLYAPAYRNVSEEKAQARKGTILANGLAAYEWAPRTGTNTWKGNIEKLTSNILAYLSPVVDPSSSSFAGFTNSNSGKVYASEGALHFEGYADATEVNVFTPAGLLLHSGLLYGDDTISLGYKGIVIVATSRESQTQTSKLILK